MMTCYFMDPKEFLGNILLAPAFFAKLKEGYKNDPTIPPNTEKIVHINA